jgi:hypothetical protein
MHCSCGQALRGLFEGTATLTLKSSLVPGEVLTYHGCCCCRPDGLKKAYVRLTPDYDALDVANKIGII